MLASVVNQRNQRSIRKRGPVKAEAGYSLADSNRGLDGDPVERVAMTVGDLGSLRSLGMTNNPDGRTPDNARANVPRGDCAKPSLRAE